jgi:hypothetical protein|tara:strand:+ start:3463 stop:3678 length:216 start_codon:yes stop_codon:yes gene_type:complete
VIILVSNTELRKQTKIRAVAMLKTGSMEINEIAAQMTQFNGWRMDTNVILLKELRASGYVDIKDGKVSVSQ